MTAGGEFSRSINVLANGWKTGRLSLISFCLFMFFITNCSYSTAQADYFKNKKNYLNDDEQTLFDDLAGADFAVRHCQHQRIFLLRLCKNHINI